ncbi:hypothetical protein NPIL_17951 [Nephila pilipes]|uniref:Uncharacterized protein n=1 Tax=Nephila pilipes TaxID=299642 RepID=A0A8X6T9I9_NEPPI|nr:hypothetical protein NPIL_17951 [Nephila pilipes]
MRTFSEHYMTNMRCYSFTAKQLQTARFTRTFHRYSRQPYLRNWLPYCFMAIPLYYYRLNMAVSRKPAANRKSIPKTPLRLAVRHYTVANTDRFTLKPLLLGDQNTCKTAVKPLQVFYLVPLVSLIRSPELLWTV